MELKSTDPQHYRSGETVSVLRVAERLYLELSSDVD